MISMDAVREAIAEVAKGAVARELERRLPFDEIDLLARSGIGALRVPVELGGLGLSIPTLLDTVVDLAAADSNIAQILRGHFAYVEILRCAPASEARDRWLRRFAAGDIVGSAASENDTNKVGDINTQVRESADGWVVDGKKFYSTGSLYADWVHVSAESDGRRVMLLVDARGEGVTRVDDWNGVGQRLTGSGTTTLEGVHVESDTMQPFGAGGPDYLQAFYQLYHVATVAGVCVRAADDVTSYVRGRSRSFLNANAPRPGDDPQVLEVVGRVASAAYALRAIVTVAAAEVGAAADALADAGSTDAARALADDAELAAFTAQVASSDLALDVTARIFEVGGGTMVTRDLALDRHWRNVRTLLSHNPVIYKARMVGESRVHERGPNAIWDLLASASNSPSAQGASTLGSHSGATR
jgi:alkylation response protein AidB-like acyl-CoA dehydrogenase